MMPASGGPSGGPDGSPGDGDSRTKPGADVSMDRRREEMYRNIDLDSERNRREILAVRIVGIPAPGWPGRSRRSGRVDRAGEGFLKSCVNDLFKQRYLLQEGKIIRKRE